MIVDFSSIRYPLRMLSFFEGVLQGRLFFIVCHPSVSTSVCSTCPPLCMRKGISLYKTTLHRQRPCRLPPLPCPLWIYSRLLSELFTLLVYSFLFLMTAHPVFFQPKIFHFPFPPLWVTPSERGPFFYPLVRYPTGLTRGQSILSALCSAFAEFEVVYPMYYHVRRPGVCLVLLPRPPLQVWTYGECAQASFSRIFELPSLFYPAPFFFLRGWAVPERIPFLD